MGQVIAFDDARRNCLRLKLLAYARDEQPVMVETTTGLHPCMRIVCHDTHVELIDDRNEKEFFPYRYVLSVCPRLPLALIAEKARYQIQESKDDRRIVPFAPPTRARRRSGSGLTQ
ncbi:hypothetical protein [Pseudorhodoplanes sp.]|jgi:hypothetical protein|uniref:hypothetical protein n=1 Tax=Pseudorhodoplanes sp. TaxID=1934341 RepID=UPI002B986D4F|nr:hypothetical protein [Pseudorhodoplanes sp.]HWV42734.1 hypothetical protein [Pseudorhodoplanes sp.]